MRISGTYRSKEKEWGSSHSEVIIGRVEDRSGRSLDLTPDSAVSRLHAPIWQAMAATGSKNLIAPVEQTGRCRNQITEPQRISDGERYLGWANRLVRAYDRLRRPDRSLSSEFLLDRSCQINE